MQPDNLQRILPMDRRQLSAFPGLADGSPLLGRGEVVGASWDPR